MASKKGFYSLSEADKSHKVNDKAHDLCELCVISKSPSQEQSQVPSDNKELPSPHPPRKQWRCRREFLWTCIAVSLGSANLWKYPFVAKESGGGGVFLIAYIVLTASFAMPMCLVESILPQYSGMGPITVWNLAPISKGIGISNLLILIMTLPSNCITLAYHIYYIGSSFSFVLPWTRCSEGSGADERCSHDFHKANINASSVTLNVTSFNWTSSHLPTKEFLEKYVLNQNDSEDITHIGSIQWQLLLCMIFIWIIIFLCTSKGIRSVGRLVTFTMPFVYVSISLLMVRMMVIDGGLSGIAYFFNSDWSKLIDINLWTAAAQQLIFGLGVSSGAKAAFASHNVFHHKIQIDAWILWAATTIANIMISLFVYATVGIMANITNTTIGDVPVSDTFRLSFILFPEVIAETLKIPQLWSVIYFVTRFVMKIVSQLSMVLVIYIGVQDVWPSMRKRMTLWIFGICFFLFILSLPSITNGGYYVTSLINDYFYVWVGFVVLMCEEVTVCGIYGLRRYISEMGTMAGLFPWLIYKISWTFLAPLIICSVLVVHFLKVIETGLGNENDSEFETMWVVAVGWILPGFCLSPIPLVAIFTLAKYWTKGDVSSAFKPTTNWKPNLDLPHYWNS